MGRGNIYIFVDDIYVFDILFWIIHTIYLSGFLGSLSLSTSLLISPITISFCRRKSTRVTAVLGGLVTSLGCLFASFAVQYHQLVLSYGVILGMHHIDMTSMIEILYVQVLVLVSQETLQQSWWGSTSRRRGSWWRYSWCLGVGWACLSCPRC